MFGHTIGKSLGLGYIENNGSVLPLEFIENGHYEIEIAGKRIPAEARVRPFYDPSNRKVKDLIGLHGPSLAAVG
jgi:4-methylaminobutanoate oxidase (formaldehyde-forming)